MPEEPQQQPSDFSELVKSHRLIVFIVGSIIIALSLVVVALGLYNSSGTSQLDLSRPGYDKIRQQAAKDDTEFKGFSDSGSLDKATLDEFDTLYMKKLKEIQAVDAFGNDVLSLNSLQIDQDSALRTLQPNSSANN